MQLLKNEIGSYKFKPASNGKSKKTIVFIHGFATNSDYHDEISNKFENYNYYALELPGHGYTEINENTKITLDLLLNFCLNMINALKLDNIILIGHSMGGGLAVRVANRLGDKINKVVAVTPMNSSFTISSLKFFFLFTPNSFNKTLALNNVLYKDLTKTINLDVENYISKEHEYQAKHLKFFKKLKNQLYSIKNVQTCAKEEKKLITNTFVIVGEFDKTIPCKSAIKAFKRPNKKSVQVSIFRNSAHLPFQEEPEQYFREIMDFIE